MKAPQGHAYPIPYKTIIGRNEKGFTLIEVIIAIAILSVGLLALASMQVAAIKGNAHANRLTEATTLAQDKVEELISLQYTVSSTDTRLTAGEDEEVNPPEGYDISWQIIDGPNTNPKVVQDTKLIIVTIHRDDDLLKKDIVFTCVKPKRK